MEILNISFRTWSISLVNRTQKSKSKQPQSIAKRIIKKYPNRRLYDTSTSSYVTLSQVKDLVAESTELVVFDAKTNEDITRSILLQIILEEETGGVPIFTQPALVNIIRFYGQFMHGFMGDYIEKNMQSFLDLQIEMAGLQKPASSEALQNLKNMKLNSSHELSQNFSEKSRKAFELIQRQMQEQMENYAGINVKVSCSFFFWAIILPRITYGYAKRR